LPENHRVQAWSLFIGNDLRYFHDEFCHTVNRRGEKCPTCSSEVALNP
jgi:hypothetical protein